MTSKTSLRLWRNIVTAGAVVCTLVLFAPGAADAQLTYRSGQPVSPAYEGWEEDEDGSKWFVFGYMNSNWEETPYIPVGPNNYLKVLGDPLSAGPGADAYDAAQADQGQPTYFQPRRNRFVFRMPVPDEFDDDDEVIWRLTVNDETVTAYGTMALDYKVDNMIKASEQGALGAGQSDPKVRANIAPTVTVEGPTERTVRVGEPLSLALVASDDGVPPPNQPGCETQDQLFERIPPGTPCGWAKPRQITVGSSTGLRVSWMPYRGEHAPTFEPEQAKTWEDTRAHANSPWAPYWAPPELPEDGRVETQVTFDQPGTYVLRALASDGALNVASDITVTVTP